MELGSSSILWFPIVPEYNGNRTQPEASRLYLEGRRLRSIDVLAQLGWEENPDEMYAWRDSRLKQWIANPEYGDLIKQIPLRNLKGMRQFIEHTRGFRNFVFEGEEKTDPVEIFLLLAGTISEKGNLIGEITSLLSRTAILTGDDLKNFVGQCAGSSTQTTTALPVPADSGPESAGTRTATTAL